MTARLESGEIPAARRHVYFYVLLVLVTLLLNTHRRLVLPTEDGARLSAEVTELIELAAFAKDLY
jgi:hypothetical protein